MSENLRTLLRDTLIEARAIKHVSPSMRATGLLAAWRRRKVRPGDQECFGCGRPMVEVGRPLPYLVTYKCRCGDELTFSRPDLRR